ncbi:MAG TPA: ZIP family metal transporter [Allosphingosinicella sp.]
MEWDVEGRNRRDRIPARSPPNRRRNALINSIVLTGFLGSLAAGLATVVGALPLFATGKPSVRLENGFLGFAAGVMLAASFFSLIIPGLEQARSAGFGRVESAAIVVGAVLIGGTFLGLLNRMVPSLERAGFSPREGISVGTNRRIWLFVAAITLHNFPEGMAVGVSFGTGDFKAGCATALGIGLQNIPEGLAVAVALMSIGHSRGRAIVAALASGLVEPVGGFVGVATVTAVASLLPWALGFAAGAMIYVVSSEIIPHAHRREGGGLATIGLMIGLAAMMFLDISLG